MPIHCKREHPSNVKKAISYSQALRLELQTTTRYYTQNSTHSKKKSYREATHKPSSKQKLTKYTTSNAVQIRTLRYKTQQENLENFSKFTKGDAFHPLIITYSSSYNKSPRL